MPATAPEPVTPLGLGKEPGEAVIRAMSAAPRMSPERRLNTLNRSEKELLMLNVSKPVPMGPHCMSAQPERRLTIQP
jgi:hypothetical protein